MIQICMVYVYDRFCIDSRTCLIEYQNSCSGCFPKNCILTNPESNRFHDGLFLAMSRHSQQVGPRSPLGPLFACQSRRIIHRPPTISIDYPQMIHIFIHISTNQSLRSMPTSPRPSVAPTATLHRRSIPGGRCRDVWSFPGRSGGWTCEDQSLSGVVDHQTFGKSWENGG